MSASHKGRRFTKDDYEQMFVEAVEKASISHDEECRQQIVDCAYVLVTKVPEYQGLSVKQLYKKLTGKEVDLCIYLM